MNIVNKLTLRNLIKNKRRTLVTIIGVIISVAMVTAVSTLAVSFIDLMKKQSIADGGEWHVLYKDVNKEQLDAIETDEDSKTVILSKDNGYALLEGSQNEYKPYLFLKSYNEQGFAQFPIKLIEGRLPKTADEVVISDHIATNADVHYQIGDTLTLEIGDRYASNDLGKRLDQTSSFMREDDKTLEALQHTTTTTLTIVGIIERPNWEPTWSPGYTIISYMDEKTIAASETVNASVVLNKVNRELYQHAEKLAKEINFDPEAVAFNNDLLRYHGITNNDGLAKTLYSLSAIIMSVIMVGSVSLIYNAFAISVSERSRQLGMLSSVGATKRQKRNSVFFEGAVIGLISIPIGIVSGLIGIGITFYFINSMIEGALGVTEKLTVTVTPLSILVACVVSILTIFISTYIPAMRASRVSAIDAIRQTMDVKLAGKAVKTSKLVRKIFGIEAELGLKNLKRNNRRYIATVFSLVISIVLFLTVAYFTDSLRKSAELSQEGLSYDMSISYSGQDEEDWNRITQLIANMEDVTTFSITKKLHLSAPIDKVEIAKELESIYDDDEMLENGTFPYHVALQALDEKSLQAYAKEVGMNAKQLHGTNTLLPAIVVNTITHYDWEVGKYVETKSIYTKIGNTIDLFFENMDDKTNATQLTVAALTDKVPMGSNETGIGGINVIVSEDVFNEVAKKADSTNQAWQFYLTSSDPMKTQQDIEELKEASLYIFNDYKNRQEEQQLITILSVFVYGFIALITAISVANIFNTISTSVSLRKREFGMLKSVGMTPKGFNKMINYESIFYGVKSLLYGIPLSIGVMLLIYRSMMHSFDYNFELPWMSLLFVVIAIFVIVGSAMLYSSSKIKKENIIDALKQENI